MQNSKNNKEAFSDFLRRFHLVIFVVVIVLSLSVAVFLLNVVVNRASGTDSTLSPTATDTFDQATIDRIEQLKTSSDQSTPLDFSNGRISPFDE